MKNQLYFARPIYRKIVKYDRDANKKGFRTSWVFVSYSESRNFQGIDSNQASKLWVRSPSDLIWSSLVFVRIIYHIA